jgi:type IX secretion system PorP/SprF family membrane protein
MKKYYIAIAIFITTLHASAQQIQLSSFYDLQGLLHNPAMAGALNKNIVAVAYRSQWSGINGGPKTATVFGSVALPKFGAGVGGYIFNDATGPISRRGVAADFAKHININEHSKFSLGIELKVQQFVVDKTKFTSEFQVDPVLGNAGNSTKFDAGFGVAYVDENFQIGASVSQLIQSKLQLYSGNLNRTDEARLYRHYYLHGAYTWNVDESNKVIPNAVVTYLPNAPMELQGGINVEHKNLLWVGVGARLRQSYTLTAGVIVKDNFRIGYSFDSYKTPLSVFDGGFNAHEIALRYQF